MNGLLANALQLAALLPLVGAAWVHRITDSDRARRLALICAAGSLVFTLLAWYAFVNPRMSQAALGAGWEIMSREVLTLDELSAPLPPLVALLHFLTILGTVRNKARKFSFSWALVSQSIALLTVSCVERWGVIGFLAAGTLPPYLEIRARGASARAYVLHMALFIVLLVWGETLIESKGSAISHMLWPVVPLACAVMIRSGILPFHCWATELFDRAPLGTALLFTTPLMGAYAAVRLVLPVAHVDVLRVLGMLSLATAIYTGCLALVQQDVRRFFCCVLLSHSALVLVGLETCSAMGVTGGLLVWLSTAVSMTGFALTLRLVEARHGRLSLARYHGLYENTPLLAICFLITGLASVGFPGTLGFLGTDLLVDAAVQVYPHVGIAVVIVGALNGIAIVQAYIRLFTGTRPVASVHLRVNVREQVVVFSLVALLLGGGLYPQPNVRSRHDAALQILTHRAVIAGQIHQPAKSP